MLPTTGKVVLVTGANRGIGKTVAEHLDEAGYCLSLGAREPDSLQAMTRSWDQPRVHFSRYDAQDHDTHCQWVDATVATSTA